ncbi:MAG: cell division ATP-binding protein FtsE [Erysipelotrichaceae bacterium]|nr:cell division ATP-binding protein FtsE [Erysipelotrichaceae bacterium]
MISIQNASKTYKNGTHALSNISLEIKEGEFVYIVGPTGSGKSTLIKLLDGEEVPDSGLVMVAGTNVGKLRHSKVPLYRRNIGVVFQNYRLLPRKTAFENVAYAMEVVDTPKDQLRKRVREVLKLVDVADKSNSFPDQLSGGQQQRVAIARAIANKPKILIADEPTGNLDPKKSDEIIRLLEKINKEEGTTILIVTHDSTIVKHHPKRMIALDSGHIVADLAKGGSIG